MLLPIIDYLSSASYAPLSCQQQKPNPIAILRFSLFPPLVILCRQVSPPDGTSLAPSLPGIRCTADKACPPQAESNLRALYSSSRTNRFSAQCGNLRLPYRKGIPTRQLTYPMPFLPKQESTVNPLLLLHCTTKRIIFLPAYQHYFINTIFLTSQNPGAVNS
jgi:hypothetical protein